MATIHLEPVEGREEIKTAMTRMRDSVQCVDDATVAGMNAGKTFHELMEEIQLSPELELSQVHGQLPERFRARLAGDDS